MEMRILIAFSPNPRGRPIKALPAQVGGRVGDFLTVTKNRGAPNSRRAFEKRATDVFSARRTFTSANMWLVWTAGPYKAQSNCLLN